jgi:catechol 2,3-dioxygenase
LTLGSCARIDFVPVERAKASPRNRKSAAANSGYRDIADAFGRGGFMTAQPLRPPAGEAQPQRPIHRGVKIGHVHLKVADLDRALAFYCGVLGFELMQRHGGEAAFIAAGGYHHHIGLNTWESRGGQPPPPGSTGLYHTAILYPTRVALADALRRLIAAGIRLDGASDHGVSEALYLRDPDENGVELYRDRPPDEWPRAPTGELAMFTRRLDLDGLLQESPA